MSRRKTVVAAFLGLVTAVALVCSVQARAEEDRPAVKNYGQVKAYLGNHAKCVELANQAGGRVLVCPEYQGRVMTSSLDGDRGMSFGFVCRDFIDKGTNDLRFNNFGGEDRIWLSPEGGQFSLWFKPGVKKQTLEDWYTPKDMNEGPWNSKVKDDASEVRMTRAMNLLNNSGTKFKIDAAREVRLLDEADIAELFGKSFAETLDGGKAKSVGYETINSITNRGKPWSKKTGLLSIWILGMFNSSPKAVVIVPYVAGDEAELGPVVCSDYFGELSEDRLKVLPEAILFRADSKYRSKIGTSRRRAVDVLGSIDFENEVLTLVKFNIPKNPAEADYMNNLWENPLKKPYDGDVINSYNNGPSDLGGKVDQFYELETLSPARELKTGETLTHKSRTLHVKADMKTLGKLAKAALGVDLKTVRTKMMAEKK